MNYPFECPKCNHSEIVSMPIKEYTSSGHYCPICGKEMVREVKSLVCSSVDHTNSFYRRNN